MNRSIFILGVSSFLFSCGGTAPEPSLVSLTQGLTGATSPCAGQCSTAPATACASTSDCGAGAACVFPDSCLPGAPELIRKVLPATAQYVSNVYSAAEGWQAPAGMLTDEGGVLKVTPTKVAGGDWSQIRDLFDVPIGKRYFLGALVKADPGTWTQLRIVGHGIPADALTEPLAARDVVGPSDWQFIGVSFTAVRAKDTDPTQTSLSLRIYAKNTGAGVVRYKGFVLYEIGDCGTYVRIKQTSPAAAGKVDLRALRHSELPAALGRTPVQTDAMTLTAGTFSAWKRIDDWLPTEDQATVAFTFKDGSGKELSGVTAQFQVATQPSASAVYFDASRTLTSGHVSMILPEGRYPQLGLKSVAGFLRDRITQDRASLGSPGSALSPQPTNYWLASRFNNNSLHLDGITEVSASLLGLYHDIGLTAVNLSGSGFPASLGSQAQAAGLNRGQYFFRTWSSASHLGATGSIIDYDLTALRASIVKDAASRGPKDISTLYKTTPSLAVLDVGDEISGFSFGGTNYAAAFRSYLAAKVADPTVFGAGRTDFSGLEPLHGLAWSQVDSLRPYGSDRYAAALFYWRIRFWNYATAALYRQAHNVIRTNPDWGGDYRVTADLGAPWVGAYFTYRIGTEVLEMLKADPATGERGLSLPFSEDWLTLYDFRASGEQTIGLIADYCSAAARSAGTPLGSHITGSMRQRKLLSWIARGAEFLHQYSYGTYDLEDVGFGGQGAQTTSELKDIITGNRLVAQAEAQLYGGQRPAAAVAMLAAQTDPLWTSSVAVEPDDQGTYIAMRHGHQQVDFLFEEDVAKGSLTTVTAAPRVLLANEQFLRNDAFGAIKSWVEAGGTLQLGIGGLTHDEYAQALASRSSWLGVAFGAVQPAAATAVQVSWEGSPISTKGKHRTLSLTGAGKVLATYDDGTAAAVEVTRGKGRVRIIGFELGRAYAEDALKVDGHFLLGYQSAAGSKIRQLTESLNVPRPVWTDNPRIEAHRVNKGTGGAILLLSYVEGRTPVQVTIPSVAGCVTAQKSGAKLSPVATTATTATYQLDIDDVDILTF